MTGIFYAVLKASFQGSVVILAVLFLRLLLKKAPKSVFCLLWLLAGLRLVLPFEIESKLSLQPQVQAPELSIQAQQPVQVPDFVMPDVPEGAPDPVNPGNYEAWENESFLYKENEDVLSPVTIGDAAAQIWLLGMGTMLLASLWSYWKLKRRVRMAYLIENGCFECPGLETAFVLGFLPPKIYLPAGLRSGEKKFIIDHENTHIARGDHWCKLLGYLVLSLHWFNPLVWIGYSLLCRDIELACDERVVKFMSLSERKAYSAALLSCGGHTAGLAACPVAFGESNPKKRILNVLHYKRPGFWISLTAVVAVIFVAVCLLTSPREEMLPAETDLVWNLEMKVKDPTPSGAQVVFVQSGLFQGCERATLQYGSYYTLERWEEEAWVAVEALPQEYEVGWTTVAYLIELNSTNAFNVNWEWLYGQLPAGRYRIGKNVDLFRMAGDYESEMFWAEFTIEQTQPAWHVDMTDGEFLDLCRNAVEEFQSRESYHLSETMLYYENDREDARSHVAYWSDGTNNARQSYVPRTEETRTHLYYDGQLYYRVQADGEEATWSLVESDHGERYNLSWLHLLDWDAQEITFEFAEEGEGVLHVFLTAHSTPVVFGWDDVTEYTVGFFFDQSGRMINALMGSAHGEIRAMSDLKMETTSADSVRTKLEQMAQQRPAELVQDRNAGYVEKCREAMMALQNSEELYLYVSDLDDPNAVSNIYMHAANGWLFKYLSPDWDYEEVQWLRLGNTQYLYGGDLDDNGIMTAPYYWQVEKNPGNHNYQLPYPFDLDWETLELVYAGTTTEFGFETVTVLCPLYLDEFAFRFSPEGELLYFQVGDSTGEPEATTSRFSVQFPYDGTVADYLAGLYAKASAQAGKKPGVPEDAFYEELFTRVTDGHYTEDWIYDLFKAFYAFPEEFVGHLADSDRAEEILNHMGYSVKFHAPARFVSVLASLRENPDTDPTILALLEAIG